MREIRTYGSERGAPSNGRPYRDLASAEDTSAKGLEIYALRMIECIENPMSKPSSLIAPWSRGRFWPNL
jgi:hypothetical protein